MRKGNNRYSPHPSNHRWQKRQTATEIRKADSCESFSTSWEAVFGLLACDFGNLLSASYADESARLSRSIVPQLRKVGTGHNFTLALSGLALRR